MLKFSGMILLFLASVMLGSTAAGKLSKKAEMMRTFLKMIVSTQKILLLRRPPIGVLLSELMESTSFCELGLLRRAIMSWNGQAQPAEIWREAVSAEKLPLSKEEQKLLCEYGEILGSDALDRQLASLEILRGRWEELTNDAAEKYQKEGKLYRMMGILGGVMLIILCI